MAQYVLPPLASWVRYLINAKQFIKNPFPVIDGALGRLGPTYTFYMGGISKKPLVTLRPLEKVMICIAPAVV